MFDFDNHVSRMDRIRSYTDNGKFYVSTSDTWDRACLLQEKEKDRLIRL